MKNPSPLATILNTFSSLKGNRELQLYLLSQVFRLSGWALQQVSVSWLVYSATKSNLMLAFVNFANFLPAVILGLSGGWVADRFNRKRVLLITQTLNTILMVGFAIVSKHSTTNIHAIIWLCVGLGIVFAHDQPVRQSLLMNLIPAEKRVNAFCVEMIISTVTMMFALAGAGVLVTHYGEWRCFLFAGVTFILASICLTFLKDETLIRTAEAETSAEGSVGTTSLIDVIKYVVKTPNVRRLFWQNCIALFLGTKYGLFLPAIITGQLHGTSSTLGYLDAANSVGGAMAGFTLANLVVGATWGVPGAVVIGCACLFVLAFSKSFVLSAFVVIAIGLCFTLQNNGNYAVLQTIIPDRIRGRVIGFYLISTQLVDQLGGLYAGWGANKIGVQKMLALEGGLCGLIFLVIWWRGRAGKLNEGILVSSEEAVAAREGNDEKAIVPPVAIED